MRSIASLEGPPWLKKIRGSKVSYQEGVDLIEKGREGEYIRTQKT